MAFKQYVVPKPPSLAKAAAAKPPSDPFGLASGTAGLFGQTATPSVGAQSRAGINVGGAANADNYYGPSAPQVKAPTVVIPSVQKQAVPQAPSFSYDINTDPAYQAATSLIGRSDEQARADAQKQIRDMLLAYGDPTLAGQTALGGDATLAQAASQNPTSTTAQLKDQYQQGLQDFEQQLIPQNLTFSGYRVKQEGKAAKDYQNTLAQAAAGLNSNIGGVNANLASALQANQDQRIQAESDAANRQYQAALQGLLAGIPSELAAAAAAGAPVFEPGYGASTGAPDLATVAGGTPKASRYSPATQKIIQNGLTRRQSRVSPFLAI